MNFYLSYIYIYFHLLIFPRCFAANLMGRVSTLLCASRLGPFGGISPGQGEQPQAVTKLAAILRPPVAVYPPSILASSPIIVNQGQVVSGGPINPSHNLTRSFPHTGRRKQLAEESQEKKWKQATDEDNTKSAAEE